MALRVQTNQRRYSALAVLAVAACVASLTRASMIALAVSVPVVLFLVLRHQRFRIAWITLLIIVTSIAGFYVARASSDTIASVVEGYSVLESLQDDGRLQGRFSDYSQALRMLTESPLGSGMGCASDAMGSHFAATGGQHLTSHNLLLWVAVETGIIGLLLFLGVLSIIALAIKKLIQIEDRPIAMAACGALTVILITGFTGSTLSAYPVNLIFWTLSGCYIGYLRLKEPALRNGGER
jgi:O-antigen ligase